MSEFDIELQVLQEHMEALRTGLPKLRERARQGRPHDSLEVYQDESNGVLYEVVKLLSQRLSDQEKKVIERILADYDVINPLPN